MTIDNIRVYMINEWAESLLTRELTTLEGPNLTKLLQRVWKYQGRRGSKLNPKQALPPNNPNRKDT